MKKDFDCVEMKRKAQHRLRKEYEANRDKYSSFAEFLNATADASPETRAFRRKTRARRATERS